MASSPQQREGSVERVSDSNAQLRSHIAKLLARVVLMGCISGPVLAAGTAGPALNDIVEGAQGQPKLSEGVYQKGKESLQGKDESQMMSSEGKPAQAVVNAIGEAGKAVVEGINKAGQTVTGGASDIGVGTGGDALDALPAGKRGNPFDATSGGPTGTALDVLPGDTKLYNVLPSLSAPPLASMEGLVAVSSNPVYDVAFPNTPPSSVQQIPDKLEQQLDAGGTARTPGEGVGQGRIANRLKDDVYQLSSLTGIAISPEDIPTIQRTIGLFVERVIPEVEDQLRSIDDNAFKKNTLPRVIGQLEELRGRTLPQLSADIAAAPEKSADDFVDTQLRLRKVVDELYSVVNTVKSNANPLSELVDKVTGGLKDRAAEAQDAGSKLTP